MVRGSVVIGMNTSFFQRLRASISAHKTRSVIIALIVIVIGYFVVHAATAKTPPPSYVLGTVQTGTIVSTVTGSGQISTSDTVTIKPQVSGQLLASLVQAGQPVKRGQVLFTIQATDAARAVRTAQDNLASAQLALRAAQSQDSTSTGDLAKAVKNAYITLLSSNLQALPADLTTSGYNAPTISGNFTLAKEGTITITTYSSQGGISFLASGLTSGVGLTNTTTPQPIGDSGLYIIFPSGIKGGLTWNIAIPNTNASSYISNENAYETAQENQTAATDPNGSTAVDLASKQLAVTQAQDNLASAEETLAEYTITSPFDGTLASVTGNVGDQVSSADTLGTVITNQEIATLSLNEVDVSKVQVGQKATLTFDAINGLTLTGTVSTVDPVGTVSSGVVNYTVTISLDTQDARIKSGMSVTAAIQAGIAQDVLTVPASAIKTINGSSYVLTVPANDAATPSTANNGVILSVAPIQTPVEIGLTDGTDTEITSGLMDGQQIVTRTVAATTAKTTATPSATSLLGGGGARGGGGGGVRIGG
jgi:RND family efflux transporter MFP subunit